jgi:hypothetical protein
MAEPNMSLAVIGSEAFELAEFELPVSTKPAAPILWSIQKYEVAQMVAMKGLSRKEISKVTGVPLATITRWLSNGEFTEYINKIIVESATLAKAKRLQFLTKVLDARMEEAELNGDFAGASKKDTLDVISELRKETEGEDKQEESNYMKLFEKLIDKTQTIQVINQ